MTSLLHSLHIGTLATWLSVAGFGTVAVIVPNRTIPPVSRAPLLETQWIPEDFTLGGVSSPVIDDPSSSPPAPALTEILPVPPEIPDLTERDPLPEVPESLPAPVSNPIAQTATTPRQTTRADSARPALRTSVRKSASSGSDSTAAANTGGGGGSLSNASRLAAGSMPSPDYPAEARRQGQSGTLVVEFIVDTSGRVVVAYAKSPSPWPLLNQEAVRTVRRWKFPPGPVMKLQRPITFQLR
jgi:protein TonB